MSSHPDTNRYKELLRTAGLRATPGRIRILALLEEEPLPLTVYEIEEKLDSQDSLNQVTIYRALQALHSANIVKRVNLEHDHAHFELVAGREHHHHAVCRECGHIQNIEVPHARHPETGALAQASDFALLDSYSLEFFGLCNRCALKKNP